MPADRGRRAQERAHFARGHDCAGVLHGGIIAVLEDHAQHPRAFHFGGGDHGARVLDGGGHGLFGQDVLAVRERLDGHGRVQIVRQADVHHVDLRQRDHLMPVGIRLRAGLSGRRLNAILANIAHRVDLNAVHVHQRGDMNPADAAAAYDRNVKNFLIHG